MKFFGLKMVCLLVIRVENDGGRKEDEEGQKKVLKKKEIGELHVSSTCISPHYT